MRVQMIDGQAALLMSNDLEIARVIAALGANPDRFGDTCLELDQLIPMVPSQPALFEINEDKPAAYMKPGDKAWPTDLVQWALGQEAGYRGDDLVEEKSDDFMLGYAAGKISKAAYIERFGKQQAGE